MAANVRRAGTAADTELILRGGRGRGLSGGGTSGPGTTLAVVPNTDLGTETMELPSLQPSQGRSASYY